ncbi:neutral sphingomyelinase [Schistosoma japonicum]|uniref:Neutral sphingomyelinase n=1 Tax=Schistosoma japonicum TaxID=6182 RepID=A0A4Z2D8A3_SCHJA|nr:neutral sphingomyelinase [Schistosoma japonicum]
MYKLPSLLLHSCSITCILIAIIGNKWNCGGLFTTCLEYFRTISLLLIIMFSIGIGLLFFSFILNFITICNESLDYNPTFVTIKLMILLIGSSSIFTALFIYMNHFDNERSRTLCTIGVMLAVQAVILNLFNCTSKQKQSYK